ncbi:hypothetical protein SRS16CHR_02317 [Variovorax sp. SRS16]|uniref:hypothetical protein n=1 Tax=Variovorax sp. SRS16 TaxID=282217 RepID=UPI001318910B|nr:hypothetical protein [Variovorax sp. SRS16]VTU18858.1 hypothetical protein SRS16CHR_02317 [Variovorax sp. SRS16]
MHRFRLQATGLAAALLMAAAAHAQPAPGLAQAQQRYEREIAACNNGSLPAPAREGCIRNAGQALDRARGGPATDVVAPTPDGRAVIVSPAGATPPSSGSDATTSRDGRATIVLPADAPPAK